MRVNVLELGRNYKNNIIVRKPTAELTSALLKETIKKGSSSPASINAQKTVNHMMAFLENEANSLKSTVGYITPGPEKLYSSVTFDKAARL